MMQIHLRKNKRLSSFLLINTLSQVACYPKVDPGLFLQLIILSMVGQELVAWASQHILPQARMGMGPAWRLIWRDLPVKAISDWLTDPTQQHSEWLSNTCLINDFHTLCDELPFVLFDLRSYTRDFNTGNNSFILNILPYWYEDFPFVLFALRPC